MTTKINYCQLIPKFCLQARNFTVRPETGYPTAVPPSFPPNLEAIAGIMPQIRHGLLPLDMLSSRFNTRITADWDKTRVVW
jgi:hypothetical protein